jgi:hypothetical protein
VATAACGSGVEATGVQLPDDRVEQRDLRFGRVGAHLLETGLHLTDQPQLFHRPVDGYMQSAAQMSDSGQGGVSQSHYQRQDRGEGQQQFYADSLGLHRSSTLLKSSAGCLQNLR